MPKKKCTFVGSLDNDVCNINSTRKNFSLDMNRRIIFFLLLLNAPLWAYALDKQLLADSLTAIATSHTYVENVEVNRIRVRNSSVSVYTNRALSGVSLSEEEVQDIRRMVSRLVFGNNKGKVSIYTDGYELGELVTTRYRHRPRNARYTIENGTPWVTNASQPYTVSKGLEGKHIALWGSHGRYYSQDQQRWLWQRAKVWTTVEDVYTSSYVQPFLVPMLENAGAIVVQPRERDTQRYEQVVDESEAQTVGTQAFHSANGAGWGHPHEPLLEGQNPFTMGQYAVAKSTAKGNAELRYFPSLPANEYAVYVSYHTLPNSTDKAHYTVVHRGQKTHFFVNQRMGGGTWVYLGTFAFGNDKQQNYVSLSNEDGCGQVITADAVRFGGGMGSVARYPQPEPIGNIPSSRPLPKTPEIHIDSAQLLANQQLASTSGMPRYLEGARYWMQYVGIPDSIYNYTDSRNDYIDDYASRGGWVNYLAGGSVSNPNEPGLGIPVCLSMAFHTDAGTRCGDTIIGTLMIYTNHDDNNRQTYPTGATRLAARDLADYVQTQIVEDMHIYAPDWTRRQLNNSSYAEARRPKVPAILLELLSHQNYRDMQFGLDPRVKFTISRAIYKGILRFMHEQYGTTYVVQPLPVQQMCIRRADNRFLISWAATPDTLEPSAQPAYYVVYTRMDDGDWDNGVRVNTTTYTLQAQPGRRYDVRVVAGNAGGVSMPSETLSAYIAPDEKGNVLIVNGFNRVSGPEWFSDSIYKGIRSQAQAVPYGMDYSYIGEQYESDSRLPWVSDDESGWGMCYSDQQSLLTAGNTFDYVCLHGRVLARNGYSYISTSAAALDSVPACDMVDLILGKQKTTLLGTDTAFYCIPQPLQQVLTRYLQQGGRLLLSGAYIASDMQSNEDQAFIRDVLHYMQRGTHATHTGQVVIERELPADTHTFRITPNEQRIHTENPDGLTSAPGSQIIARYADTGVGAAVAYTSPDANGSRTLCWSFMLESAYDFNTLYQDCIQWLMK